MMQTRPDWCLSRQRAWGVPIPAVSCNGCGQFHADPVLIEHIEQIFRERGSDAWYELSPQELVPAGYHCSACGGDRFTPDDNILDVWFDAGCSHDAVLNERQLGWPADLYVEAVDQHRGWFQVSLITSVATTGKAPYRSVLTHGLILDERAKKMSKSLGNVVSPDDIIAKHGADILRLLFASVDFTADTAFSQGMIPPLLESYRRIRNTCRFLLGNLAGFDPDRDAVPVSQLPEIDRWILHRAQRLLARAHAAYDEFALHLVVQGVINFCAIDLSALYLDIVKDRLYTFAPSSPARRAAQTTLHQLLHLITRTVAPVLSYTADEIWSYVPGARAATVFEAGLPEVDAALVDDPLAEKWDRLLDARAVVTKALEEARQQSVIGHSLDARVELVASNGLRDLLEEQRASLPAFLIVSQVDLSDAPSGGAASGVQLPDLAVAVSPARGAKCARCWNYSEAVGRDATHPELCERCLPVVQTLLADSQASA
jgi:isoleucyl-tRNA synthetase